MTLLPTVIVASCPLCGSSGPLQDSHIIPRFVFEWLLESSGTGHMRFGPTPNRRVQDGFKQPLLCRGCESRLSSWESETARSMFRPYHQDTSDALSYGPWFSKFCASVCWRVLFIFRGLGMKNYSTAQNQLADQALQRWRYWLHDRVPHPAQFELHVLPVDLIADFYGGDLPPNINRYLARAVEMDAVSNENSAFVYAKLCKLILIGFVQTPNPREWVGTRVATRYGSIRPDRRGAPSQIWHYIADRARAMARLQASMSDRQKAKIEQTMRTDLDRVAESETFAAMAQDVSMFGRSAFSDADDLAK